MRRRGKQTSLGGGLKDAIKRLGGLDRVREADLAGVWAVVAGEEIARHTHILGLRQGELSIGVDSNVWATELTALSEKLRCALNSQIGQETVRHMRFTVSKKVGAEQQRESREDIEASRRARKVDPVPLPTETEAAIRRAFAGVSDEGLREAAVRAAIKGLEWKRGEETPNGPYGATGGSTEHE